MIIEKKEKKWKKIWGALFVHFSHTPAPAHPTPSFMFSHAYIFLFSSDAIVTIFNSFEKKLYLSWELYLLTPFLLSIKMSSKLVKTLSNFLMFIRI